MYYTQIPTQEYKTVVVDPPWTPSLHATNSRRFTKDKAGPQKHYNTMTLEQIKLIKPNLSSQSQNHTKSKATLEFVPQR